MRTKRIAVAALAALPLAAGCLQPKLPVTAPRQPVAINASLNRTWETVLALFAERNLAVTQDSTARTIYTATLQIPEADTGGEDCPNQTESQILRPQYVTYRVGVKGDSTRSSVAAFAYYSRMPGTGTECASRGEWETQFEAEVKRRAEQP